MKGDAKMHFLRGERGFSLAEVMTTIIIMLVVMFALYSIFDMTIRIFSVGNDKIEAIENARLGLEKMEREIRGAYPYDLTTDPQKTHLFFSTATPTTGVVPTGSQITFGHELNGNGKVECPNAANICEYITYKVTSTANPATACTTATMPCTLRRVNTANSADAGQPMVEFVQSGGLTFSYFESDGTSPENEDEITRVRMQLQIAVDRGIQEQPVTQTLTTDVDLRSRT